MAHRWIMIALLASIVVAACQPITAPSASAPATAQSTSAPRHQLAVGDIAPDFTLQDQNRNRVTLSDFRGKTVQLAFYVWAFSGG